FRLEAEMRSASPEMQAAAFLSLSKCAIKVVVDEVKDTSAVIASFDMDCYGSVYSGKTVRLARDAYSVKNEVGVTVSGFTNRFVTAQYGTAEKISGSTDHEFTDGAEIVAVVGERIENVGLNADNNLISGVISATVIEASENGYSGKRAAVPFEVPFAGNKSTEYAICAAIENFGYRLRNTLDFDAAIRFSVTEKVTEQYTAVSEITVGDEKTEKTTAISVYIAKGNDTLWDVCKELGVSAEVIAELNPEVTFPLTGAERIIVYRNM
ncbi:MAG: LysM peptidoglycan-binding domain-containing protein, partial [Clostridia bacterium]|nr:LysM peptidoglycan-binding domain-containing protein [Clostridia bacterium]